MPNVCSSVPFQIAFASKQRHFVVTINLLNSFEAGKRNVNLKHQICSFKTLKMSRSILSDNNVLLLFFLLIITNIIHVYQNIVLEHICIYFLKTIVTAQKSTTRSDNLLNRPFFQVSTQIAVTGKLRLQIK